MQSPPSSHIASHRERPALSGLFYERWPTPKWDGPGHRRPLPSTGEPGAPGQPQGEKMSTIQISYDLNQPGRDYGPLVGDNYLGRRIDSSELLPVLTRCLT